MVVELDEQQVRKMIAMLNTLEIKGIKNMTIVLACEQMLEGALVPSGEAKNTEE